jgi:ketosteroid isomerase-like protein
MNWEDEIKQIEDECRVAFLAQDLERLRQLWAEEMVVNSPLNRVNTRAQVLDLLERGIIRHVSQELHFESITRHGGMIVVMGYDVVKNSEDGPTLTRRFTNVWSAAEGSWKLVARQATVIGSS